MYKRCAYHLHPSYGMLNNCCCLKPTLPRNCASCILPYRDKTDEWKCYSRCLTGFYRSNLKKQFESPLWRRARRQRDKAASMMDLPTRRLSDRCTNVWTTKTPQRIPTSAEIVIERAHECPGGRLRAVAKTPDCTCERMAQLLLQRKLCDKCKCNPYDSLPHVPLTFYPPKKPTFDIYGNSSDDEYAKRLFEYVTRDNGNALPIKQLLNKKFLRSLNRLYANVGGGGLDGRAKVTKQRRRDVKEEFEYFFGENDTDWNKHIKTRSQPCPRRSLASVGVGSDTVYDNCLPPRRSTYKPATNLISVFYYPTKTPTKKGGNIKLGVGSDTAYDDFLPPRRSTYKPATNLISEFHYPTKNGGNIKLDTEAVKKCLGFGHRTKS